jgi:hypothetical protein
VSAALQWAYFTVPSFATAYVTLFVWGKSSSMGYALVSGTLAGVVILLVIATIFWAGDDPCALCQVGKQ